MYVVTKKFVGGTLDGITIDDLSPVRFEVGRTYRGIGNSSYTVERCRPFVGGR